MSERRSQARWLALLVAAAIALYICWLMLLPFVDVLAWATVLVIVFYPAHRRILERTKSPSLSALLSSLLVIATVLIPLSLITLAIANELSGVASNLQDYVLAWLDPNHPVAGPLLNWLGQYVNIETLRSPEFLMQRLGAMSGAIAGRTLGLVGGLVGALVQVAFVIFTMYYFFRDGERIIQALSNFLPLERTQAEEILARTSEVIGASVYGVLVIAIIQGTLGGLAFWALGLPSPLVWGVVMVLLSMIPLVGAFVVWIPAAILLAATGEWPRALILAAWGTLVIGMVDNFLRPKLVGERTKLHELFIFFSVLGGLQVFGVLGIVVGPVVVAITLALLDVLRRVDPTLQTPLHESVMVEEEKTPPPSTPTAAARSRPPAETETARPEDHAPASS